MGKIRKLERAEWESLSVPDVYFTSQYYEASRLLENGSTYSALLEWSDSHGLVRLPLILREIPNTPYFDATSAYGYGGPWIEGNPDLNQFPEALDQWAQENYLICSFLRFHPLIRNAEAVSEQLSVRYIGPTAGWYLGKEEDLVGGMSKDHRKTYRRSLRTGVTARITVNPDNVDDFTTLYNASMNRLSADQFYLFSENYWEAMLNNLGNSSVMVEAVYEDRVVAAAWCLFTDKFLHYHLSGTSDEGRKLGGAVVCRVAAAQWGKERGLTAAHMGGGVGGEDSTLLRWKKKFDESLPVFGFHVSNIVHQQEIYSSLAANCADTNFFPPWRDPLNAEIGR